MHPTRRTLLKTPALLLLPTPVIAEEPTTPSATAGPFYPAHIPLDHDADLVQVEGKTRPGTGIIAHLMGKLTDQNACPIQNATIEIWQCDAFGAYHHPRDRGDIAEPEFQGYGKTQTNENGEYRFRTITPVSYPGRTPHIHVHVSKEGIEPLTTQLYLQNEPRNTQDFLYNRVPEQKRRLIQANFPTKEAESLTIIPEFNIIIGTTPTCA